MDDPLQDSSFGVKPSADNDSNKKDQPKQTPPKQLLALDLELLDQGHASGQIEVITPGDRHRRSLATLQFGDGAGQTPPHAKPELRHGSPAAKNAFSGQLAAHN